MLGTLGSRLIVLALFAVCLGVSVIGAGPPRAGQSSAAPSVPLSAALDVAGDLPRLHSLLVSWRGDLVLEHYFRGTRPTRLANVKSASKSVLSALVGIAIERGHISSIDATLGSYFSDLLPADESRKRDITIEDLLTMRSGLESTSSRNYGAWVQSGNWVRYVLRRPLVSDPGTAMEYSTGNSHLLSAILTKSTRTNTWQFANDALAGPLGFTLARWPRDPQGIYFGGNEMLLTPRQMLAFGELYLNGGRAGGRQIVPEDWVDRSLDSHTVSRRRNDRYYGYGWWTRELAGRPVHYAWGYGGQFIFLVPDLDLVVVTTSSTAVGDERRDHLRAIYDLVELLVIPPVALVAQEVQTTAGQP